MGNVQRSFNQRQQMLPAPLDDADRLLAMRRNRRVFAHELRVAQNAVQGRAEFVANGADVTAFGLIGFVSHAFGLLQGFIGLPVRINLLRQELRLPVGLFLRNLPAFMRQNQPPGDQAGNHQKRHVGF